MKFAYIIEPPFNHRGADGHLTGHDVELARRLCERMGTPFEPVETTFPELLPGLATGRWHMTTGLLDTPERRRIAAFSRPIWALPDGLLVQRGNPMGLTGYGAVACHGTARLAVIRDQVQHRTALTFAIAADRLKIFETYLDAAQSVRDGRCAAYASIGLAHAGFVARHPDWHLSHMDVPPHETPPAQGAFALASMDRGRRAAVDVHLAALLGSPWHRALAKGFGLSDAAVDLVAPDRAVAAQTPPAHGLP